MHPSEHIAVVGVGCVLPGARTVDSFWQNLIAGRCAIAPLEGGTYEWARYLDATGEDLDRATSILGARVIGFEPDWRALKIPPADVQLVNPLQFMVLDAGIQALSPLKSIPRARTGLFIGSTGLGWQRDTGLRLHLQRAVEAIESSALFQKLPKEKRARVLAEMKRTLDARLKPVTEDNVVGAAASVAAGRIAMHFDLQGLHYAVDAGFASSLAAVDVGVRALRDGTLDMAVVGGASELLTPLELVAFSRLGGMAKTRIAPFDQSAEGTLLGEGTAIFALKRLEDATRDGEDIHAVIVGVGGSSDGKGRSVVAPRSEGQAIAMRRAYEDAGVDPASVSFIECHATGTQVGDASEVRALAAVYGASMSSSSPHSSSSPSSSSSQSSSLSSLSSSSSSSASSPPSPSMTPTARARASLQPGNAQHIALGSAKAFVGHLRGAAGAVGLLRAVLSLKHRRVPRQIGVDVVNPALELETTPFFVPTSADVELPAGPETRAAVSAFGFGGNNFHVVLQAGASPRTSSAPKRARYTGDIAICSMGGRFPIGNDVPTFWQALLDRRDATREVPPERWDIERHFDEDPSRPDTSYTKIGCFLDELPTSSPSMGIPPSATAVLDPSQVLGVLAAEEALSHVDTAKWDADRVGVYMAFLPYQGKKFLADLRVNFAEYGADLEAALAVEGVTADNGRSIAADAAAAFRADLPHITEDTLTGYLGSMVAARITRLLDAHGPHFVVDSACASTHAALHAAVTALRHGVVDAALSGGVWCDMMPEFFVAACRFNALSSTGSTPFDARASGFIPGEGAGVFVLRRLDDAERAGEPILAVLRGVGGSSDGRGRSVLAPKPEGEAAAMTRALAAGNVAPENVDYVECHGTGTALGDVVEVQALTAAYGKGRARPLMIGSVKSNIGHLNAAAGVPSLMKVTLAVKHGVIPASLKVETLNPAIDFTSGPVEVVRETTTWTAPPGEPRRAGMSGFGVGGSNMHLIVEEYRGPAQPKARAPDDADLAASTHANGSGAHANGSGALPIASASGASIADCIAKLRARATGDDDGAVRLAVVARDGAELTKKLAALEASRSPDMLRAQGVFVGHPGDGGRVAVMFPGQGTQYANMARDLAARFPVVASSLAEADRAYVELCGRTLTEEFFTDRAEHWAQHDEDIHCAVFAVGVALFRQLAAFGFSPDAVMGQSAGELAALVAAGSLSFADGLSALRARTLAVLGVDVDDRGRMLSLRCGADRARELMSGIGGTLVIAAENCPTACLISGDTPATEALLAACARDGVEATVLAVSHAYHSQMIASAQSPYLAHLHQLAFVAPSVPVYSTIIGDVVDAESVAMPEHLASQFVKPVLLQGAFESMHRDGIRTFVECGPRWPLTIFADETLAGRPHSAFATMHPKVGEVEQLARAVAGLWVIGRANLEQDSLSSSSAPSAAAWQSSSAAASSQSSSSSSSPLSAFTGIGGVLDEALSQPPSHAMRRLLSSVRDAIDTFLVETQPPRAVSGLPRAASTSPTPAAPPVAPRSASTSTLPRAAPSAVAPRAASIAPVASPAASIAPRMSTAASIAPVASPAASIAPPSATTPPSMAPRTASIAPRNSTAAPSMAPRAASVPVSSAAHTASVATGAASSGARAASTAAAAQTGASVDEITTVLVARAAARTGYPAEMLELDLDLEADLGIDTVKQVAIIAETKQHFGLARDPSFKLREHNTLRKVVSYLAKSLAGVAPPARADKTAEIARVLVEKAAVRTGYPAEMLELDLDLEADLGIDTVKQVAIIAETKQHFGIAKDPSFKLRDHNTLRKIVAYLAGNVAAAPVVVESGFERVRAVIVQKAVTRTGYPADMLELDLDLEADLGIDTVKQVAIIADTKAVVGLAADPGFKLRDHNTLRKIITHLADKLAKAGQTSAPASSPPLAASMGPAPPASPREVPTGAVATLELVTSVVLKKAAARTGYPVEMLDVDLDLQADLGVDTVKLVSVLGDVREHFGLARDAAFKLRATVTLRDVIEYVSQRLASAQTAPPPPRPTQPSPSPHASAQTSPASTAPPRTAASASNAAAPAQATKTSVAATSSTANAVATASSTASAPMSPSTAPAATTTAGPPAQATTTNPAGTARVALAIASVEKEKEAAREKEKPFDVVQGPLDLPRRRIGSLEVVDEAKLLELVVEGARRRGSIGRLWMLEGVEIRNEATGPIVVSASRSDESVRVRIAQPAGAVIIAGTAHVSSKPPSEATAPSRETMHAVRALGPASTSASVPVRALNASFSEVVEIIAAGGLAFEEVAGRARVRSDVGAVTDATSIAAILVAVLSLAGAAASSLLGRHHRLQGIDRARFERAAHLGEELGVHLRLRTSSTAGAVISADAEVIDARGALVARVEGLHLADVADVERRLWQRLRGALKRLP